LLDASSKTKDKIYYKYGLSPFLNPSHKGKEISLSPSGRRIQVEDPAIGGGEGVF
jgi:hypothetical protein